MGDLGEDVGEWLADAGEDIADWALEAGGDAGGAGRCGRGRRRLRHGPLLIFSGAEAMSALAPKRGASAACTVAMRLLAPLGRVVLKNMYKKQQKKKKKKKKKKKS